MLDNGAESVKKGFGNISALLLAMLCAVLSFLTSRLIFDNSYYAMPLLAFTIIPISVGVKHTAWCTIIPLAASAVFFALELMIFPSAQPLPRIYALYSSAILAGLSLALGKLFWRIRSERDNYSEQNAMERTTSALSTALLTASGAEELYTLTLRSLYNITQCSTVLFLPDGKGGFFRADSYPAGLILYPVEDVVAACFENSVRSGYNSAYNPQSSLCCLPITTDGEMLAVAGLLIDTRRGLGGNQLETANILLIRAGVALKRLELMRREQGILMEKELERMRSDFLRSISHDLRTPLTGIIGACSALNQSDVPISENDKHELIQSIGEEAAWLLRMVENLLSVTRVGASGPKLNKSLQPIEEVLSETVEKAKGRFPNALINVVRPEDFIMIPMDPVLIVQVLMNLIENAVKYSNAGSAIDLTVEDGEEHISFEVRDHGKGLSKQELATLFEPSARNKGDSAHGMGLGLSICKSIIKAHEGTITGSNAQGGGAVFTIKLPKEIKDGQC